MSECRGSVFSYKAVVWDLDGTLYYQNKMRVTMLWKLVSFYALHPLRIKELLAVRKFRKVRELWDRPASSESLEEEQYEYTAKLMGLSPETVREAVETWIYDKPLKYIRACRDEGAARLFSLLKEKGIGCYIFSDYPIEEKLEALGLEADGCYAATDKRLGVLKPDPRGLELIMEDTGFKPGDLLMIGDRDSKDGEAARRAGCDYLILPKSRRAREKKYDLYELQSAGGRP